MRGFLDTYVLVSGFTTRGLSADVVRLVMAEHELLTGEVVIAELRRVLSTKFDVPQQHAQDIESLLRRFHVEPKPDNSPPIEVRDPDDAWVLASALSARADVLVTGDNGLLEIANTVQEMVITNPRGFWNLLRGQT